MEPAEGNNESIMITEGIHEIENKSMNGQYVHGSPEDIAARKAWAVEVAKKKLAPAMFGWDSAIDDEPEVVFIGNTPIGSISNISLWLGLRKAGKSTVLALMCGDRTGTFRLSLPAGKNLILIADTEQSGKYIRKLQNRIVQLYGSQPTNIIFLKLRGYSKKERLDLIKSALDAYLEIGLVIIDNIADVVDNFNDLEDADRNSTQTIQWAQHYKVHIAGILHLNKGNGLSKGHIGSSWEQRAETIVKIKKDEQQNAVIVEADATRDKPFEPFTFYFDETGMPVIQDAGTTKANKKAAKGKADPWEFTILTHTNVLDEVYKNASEYGYMELWKAVQNIAQRHDIKLGNNSAIAWVTYYKTEGLVIQNKGRKYVRK